MSLKLSAKTIWVIPGEAYAETRDRRARARWHEYC